MKKDDLVVFALEDILFALRKLDIAHEVFKPLVTNSTEYSFKSLRKVEPKGIYYVAKGVQCDIQDSILIVSDTMNGNTNTVIVVEEDPQLVFYKLMDLFFLNDEKSGIHPTAIISDKAIVHSSAYIGPYCVLGECVIEDGVELHSHVVVMDGTYLSKNVIVEPHSTIGATGVAWIWDPKTGCRVRQPQIGSTYVGEGTFLGSDVTVVRGSVNETTTLGKNCVIAHGSKIGHGSMIGDECHFANNISIAGNVTLGVKCFLGSGTVIRPQIKLGSSTVVGAGSVVVKNCLENNQLLVGVPAILKEQTKNKLSGVPALSD